MATAATRNNDQVSAFNFTQNQLLESDTNNENVLWHDGQIHHYQTVDFDVYPDYWTTKDQEGRVDLTFHKEAIYTKYKNMGLLKVNYKAPVGWFEGFLILNDGSTITIDRWFGMTEDVHNLI